MTTLFQIEPHVRSMIDEDGAILLDLEAGKYYSLNGVAASIWSRVEKKLDRDVILDELTCEYADVSRDQLLNDMQELAAGLAGKGLVHFDT